MLFVSSKKFPHSIQDKANTIYVNKRHESKTIHCTPSLIN